MKHFFLTTIITICLFGLMACKKDNNNDRVTVTISGQVVKSCDDHSPVADLELYISGDNSGFLGCKPKRISTITDYNGKFSISYNPKKDICSDGGSLSFLDLSYDDERGNVHSLLIGIPIKKADDLSFNDIVAFQKNTKLFLFKTHLNDNIYTEKDTLYRNVSHMGVEKFIAYPGPFSNDQIIDSSRFLNFSGQHYNFSQPAYDLFIGYLSTSNGERVNIRAHSESNYPCGKPNNIWIELP